MDGFKGKKIRLSDYEIMITLGTGSYGRVRLAKNKITNEYCALKMLKKSEILRLKQADHVLSENTILSHINHPFLIRMKGFTQDSRYLYFFLELVQGGELFSLLQKYSKVWEPEAVFYSAQVVEMFSYLHSKNIVYRDLKPENLLITSEGYLKLTDFGFAKYLQGRTYTLCGTPEYIAPEILLNKGHGTAVDWWTLGILIYEMLTGATPFADDDPMQIYQKVLNGPLKFPKTFPKNGKILVKKLLKVDLAKRYGNLIGGIDDIKQSEWFADIQWDKLINKEMRPPQYIPKINSPEDTSNFEKYPDSKEPPKALPKNEDPFKNW